MREVEVDYHLGDTQIVAPGITKINVPELVAGGDNIARSDFGLSGSVHERIDILELIAGTRLGSRYHSSRIEVKPCSQGIQNVERLALRFSPSLGGIEGVPSAAYIIARTNKLIAEIVGWANCLNKSLASRLFRALCESCCKTGGGFDNNAQEVFSKLLPWLDPFAKLNPRWLHKRIVLFKARNDLASIVASTNSNSASHDLQRFLVKYAIDLNSNSLQQEFKIHLNPDSRSIPGTLDLVLSWLSRSELGEKYIVQVKTSTTPHLHGSDLEPTMVLYVGTYEMSPDNGAKIVRALADELSIEFQHSNLQPLSKFGPRFSYRHSPFVFLAQSSGDIKAQIVNLDGSSEDSLISHYFDPRVNYSTFKSHSERVFPDHFR